MFTSVSLVLRYRRYDHTTTASFGKGWARREVPSKAYMYYITLSPHLPPPPTPTPNPLRRVSQLTTWVKCQRIKARILVYVTGGLFSTDKWRHTEQTMPDSGGVVLKHLKHLEWKHIIRHIILINCLCFCFYVVRSLKKRTSSKVCTFYPVLSN